MNPAGGALAARLVASTLVPLDGSPPAALTVDVAGADAIGPTSTSAS